MNGGAGMGGLNQNDLDDLGGEAARAYFERRAVSVPPQVVLELLALVQGVRQHTCKHCGQIAYRSAEVAAGAGLANAWACWVCHDEGRDTTKGVTGVAGC